MRGIICSALIALTVTAADAAEDIPSEFIATKFVLRACTRDPMEMLKAADLTAAMQRGHCFGTLFGMGEMLRLFKAGQQKPDPRICTDIPLGVDNEQMLNVVVKYAADHPERTHEPFPLIAFTALHEAWPCKK
jgi:hypothetical protein